MSAPHPKCISTCLQEQQIAHWQIWKQVGIRDIVFNATFNNILAMLLLLDLLVEEIDVPWENHRPVARNWQIVSHNVASSAPRQR